MKINLKLLAGLQKHSPTGESGFAMQVPQRATVAAVMGELNISAKGSNVILVNGRQANGQQELHDGDLLVLFPPMEGG